MMSRCAICGVEDGDEHLHERHRVLMAGSPEIEAKILDAIANRFPGAQTDAEIEASAQACPSREEDRKGDLMDEDKYIVAAQAIVADLSDRRGIGNEIDALDTDVRAEIIKAIVDIIRRVDLALYKDTHK